MAIVVLTFIPSDTEITSGIPRYMTIESNVPSTVYFTLDGSTPTLDSAIYTDTFQFPDGQTSVTLSAFGVDGDNNVGPVLTQVFAADTTDITVRQLHEGIIIDAWDDLTNIVSGYDADGQPASFQDLEDYEIELLKKDRGRLGIEEGVAVKVGIPLPQDTSFPYDDNFQPFSTPEFPEMFNPEARTIIIDNRDGKNPLNIIPKPYGSLRNSDRENGGWRYLVPDGEYVSGGYLRTFYDRKNGVMVSYYFDHNTGRHVKNISQLPENIPSAFDARPGYSGHPLVFKWIYGGRHQMI